MEMEKALKEAREMYLDGLITTDEYRLKVLDCLIRGTEGLDDTAKTAVLDKIIDGLLK